ncbi:hypothetical protein KR51_00030400 [Rubidibacter lacunae KORDI 51-2]|uniref:ATP synthase F0 subunit B n=1 Tax=Rubidibacter lacunae KORDI 51-2 TaxID=582515 RepID=U5DIS2_9CHRO|nr:hypothetical protein [Rubidibacter lacunae]ERN40494.1 hypothetical protein KR51_00030400 [Rubidibacter lacunae KORDI 51-2]
MTGANIPFTKWSVVSEDQLLAQIDAIWTNLPIAIEQASTILEQKHEILQEAEAYARETMQIAERRAAQILDDTGIVQRAQREAQQLHAQISEECDRLRKQTHVDNELLLDQAREDCDRLRDEADDYATQALFDLERQLLEMLRIARNGRESLLRAREPDRPSDPSARPSGRAQVRKAS